MSFENKFPEGYVISLTDSEKTEVVKNFDHLTKLKTKRFTVGKTFPRNHKSLSENRRPAR
jgi:hypothetical protein